MTAEAVEKMLSDAQVKDVFARAGLGAEPAGVDDKIYLIRHGDNGLNKSVFAMYKTDLLSGDAKNLASAIYAYDGGDKKNCALKAAMIVAASSYLANSKDFGDAQMKGENPSAVVRSCGDTIRGADDHSPGKQKRSECSRYHC